jgi:membrane fusion protein (multidrug efflux system)
VNRHTMIVTTIALVLIAALLTTRLAVRAHALSALARSSDERSILPVEFVAPQPGPATRAVVLPGSVGAWHEAPIFAQVAGYVHSYQVDYGARVKAGQLLATIDAPSLDAQFASAQAALRVAQANYQLAVKTASRWQALEGTPAVSQQEVDVQVAAAAARKAELDAAQQNLSRYTALEAFKRVVAPFAGVVTSRRTDVGDYVNAGGGDAGAGATATELFRVADVHALLVYVSVPEDYAQALVPGLTASLHLPTAPEMAFTATFLATAREFNQSTRTSVTELTVDNPDQGLWPGAYVDVELHVASDPNTLTIPEQALIFRAEGMQVAVADAANRVHLRSVTLGQNLGQIVQVTGGLSASDKLVNNPPAGLLEGQKVQPVGPGPDRKLASARRESP